MGGGFRTFRRLFGGGNFGKRFSAAFSRVMEDFREAFISEFRAFRRDPRRPRVAALGVFAVSLLVAWLSCLPRELFPEVQIGRASCRERV